MEWVIDLECFKQVVFRNKVHRAAIQRKRVARPRSTRHVATKMRRAAPILMGIETHCPGAARGASSVVILMIVKVATMAVDQHIKHLVSLKNRKLD